MQDKRTQVQRSHGRSRVGIRFGVMLLAAGLMMVGACEDSIVGTDDDGPLTLASLTITASETTLNESATSHFQAQARTENEVTIDTATITWTSRDPSVATIGGSTGTVTAVMHGETYIVAQTGAGDDLLSDSVLLAVTIPPLTDAVQAEVRIRGAVTESYSWDDSGGQFSASLWVEESMGGDEHDQSYLDIEFDDNGDDMGFFALFPGTGTFAEGAVDLVEATPEMLISAESVTDVLSGPVAVFMVEQGNSVLVYLGIGGTLTVESVSGEPGYTSEEDEQVTGRFSMTAVGYTLDYVDDAEEMTATGDTVEITGLFAVEYAKEQVPYATVTITNGATEIPVDVRESYISNWNNEFSVSTWGFDEDGREWYLRTTIVDPAEGSIWAYAVSNPWDYTGTRITGNVSWDDAETGEHYYYDLYTDGGEVVLEQYQDAPMPDGVAEGSVSVLLGLYQGTDHTTNQVQADIGFIAPTQERPYDEEFFESSAAADDAPVLRRILKASRLHVQNRHESAH